MSDFRIADRYAKSLLQLANEKGELEKVKNDMTLFLQVCEENRDFTNMLKSPILVKPKKLAVLKAIFSKKVTDLVDRFFELVVKKNRESLLPAVAKEFLVNYNTFKGIEEAVVTTTFKLDAATRKQFQKIVEEIAQKKVDLKEEVDPDLIGGYLLRVKDRQIDQSVSAQLKAFRYNLKK